MTRRKDTKYTYVDVTTATKVGRVDETRRETERMKPPGNILYCALERHSGNNFWVPETKLSGPTLSRFSTLLSRALLCGWRRNGGEELQTPQDLNKFIIKWN